MFRLLGASLQVCSWQFVSEYVGRCTKNPKKKKKKIPETMGFFTFSLFSSLFLSHQLHLPLFILPSLHFMSYYEEKPFSSTANSVLEWDGDSVARWVTTLGLGKYAVYFQGKTPCLSSAL